MTAEATAGGGPAMARRMWQALETLHMTVYRAPEARDAYRQAGLRGGWMGCFASRAAPMGQRPDGTRGGDREMLLPPAVIRNAAAGPDAVL